jgi:hypothetical protein
MRHGRSRHRVRLPDATVIRDTMTVADAAARDAAGVLFFFFFGHNVPPRYHVLPPKKEKEKNQKKKKKPDGFTLPPSRLSGRASR